MQVVWKAGLAIMTGAAVAAAIANAMTLLH
jgi:hypothetical protein